MVMSLLLVHLTREKSVKRPSGCFTLPNSDWLLQESEAVVFCCFGLLSSDWLLQE